MRMWVVVEGSTEELYVRNVLKNYIETQTAGEITLVPSQVITNSTMNIRGGGSCFRHYKTQIENILQDSEDYCTTMIDLYKCPRDIPNIGQADAIVDVEQKACFIEREMRAGIDLALSNRFIPNLIVHEFEGLLLTDTTAFNAIPFYNRTGKENLKREIDDLLPTLGDNPELINQGETTAPSKRIQRHLCYSKVSHGYLIAERVGIDLIRQKCHHFNNWLDTIEHVNNGNAR